MVYEIRMSVLIKFLRKAMLPHLFCRKAIFTEFRTRSPNLRIPRTDVWLECGKESEVIQLIGNQCTIRMIL